MDMLKLCTRVDSRKEKYAEADSWPTLARLATSTAEDGTVGIWTKACDELVRRLLTL